MCVGLSKGHGRNGEVQVLRMLKSAKTEFPAVTENDVHTPSSDEDVDDNRVIEQTGSKSDIENLASVPDNISMIGGLGLEKSRCLKDVENVKPHLSTDSVICDKVGLSVREDSRKLPKLCPICGKMFRALKIHMRLHQRPDFECADCGRKFARSDYVTEHRRRFHSNERPFLCGECGRSFVGAGKLGDHLRTHSDERRYLCDLCGKLFRRSSGRNEHIRNVHKGLRAYRCMYCPRAFSSANGLKSHVMGHTNERPHGCPICPKRFKKMAHMELHMAIHTGERRFPCSVCGRKFTQSSAARKHEVTQHTVDGGRCHECEICGQRFNRPMIRDAHVRRHKGEKPHACSMCHWTFAFRGDLRNHMIKKHQVKRNATAGRLQQSLASDIGF